MTSEGIERALGRLEGKMDGMHDEIKTVRIKVDRIISEGCTKGEQNDKRLARLEGVVAKSVIIGLMAGGSTIGVGKILELVIK